ncbi:MAG: IS3 family transposase [Acidimicrobiia bacterium]
MSMSRRGYPEGFRAEAVRLYRSVKGERSLRSLASELGISIETLRSWVKQADIDDGSREGLTTDERERLRLLERENRILREEREILKKAGGLLRDGDRLDSQRAFEFVSAEKANHKIATICRVLGVSTSGYYAWVRRSASLRELQDDSIAGFILDIHDRSRKTYGAPRIHFELAEDHAVRCGCKRVARLMRREGIEGCHRRKLRGFTKRDPDATPAPDLLDRNFTAPAPHRVWVADITYVPTWTGFLYVGIILDVFTRMVVGWSMRNDLGAELVTEAFDMAVHRRRPVAGAIHHSDQGSQYSSLAFGRRLREAELLPSMGSTGDCYDNALAEAFFATLETELIDRNTFRNRTDARVAVFDFIEGFYNRVRRHTSIGKVSPLEFERRWQLQNAGV